MSEPKLLNNTCPQCGGKLRVKKGIFFTFATCEQCKARLAWVSNRRNEIIRSTFEASNTVIPCQCKKEKRMVFENGVRVDGRFYYHQSLLKYLGKVVFVTATKSGVNIEDKYGQEICTGVIADAGFRASPLQGGRL